MGKQHGEVDIIRDVNVSDRLASEHEGLKLVDATLIAAADTCCPECETNDATSMRRDLQRNGGTKLG